MTLCDNFNDIESSISMDLGCYFLYVLGEDYYKITYDPKTITLREYKFMPELNNTFRLIKTIQKQKKQEIISLLRIWKNNNKSAVQILSKSQTKLFQYRNKLNESNSCWKTYGQLKKAIENGLEVPNCIPDKKYNLQEMQIFIDRKNRELMGKYKKAKDWLDTIIANGDKDYAEKIMQIIEKWKRNYEDKIRSAKGVLKEAEDYNIIFDEQEVNDYINKCERSYSFYKNKIENEFDSPYKETYLYRLNTWYTTTKKYLQDKKTEILNNKENTPVEINYKSFGLLDLDESLVISDIHKVLSENATIQKQIQDFIKYEKKLKTSLSKFKEGGTYDKLSPEEREKMIRKFYDKFIESKNKLTENIEHHSMDGDNYFKKDTDTSFYNDILHKPTYMFWVKGYFGKIVYMTPDSYFERCARMQKSTVEEQLSYVDKEVAEKYMEKMLDGEKFPMPYIDFKDKVQEGRHRSYAIKMINPSIKIPVLCVYNKQEDRNMLIDGVKNGDSYEDFVRYCQHVGAPYDEKYYDAIKNNKL